MLEFLNPNFDRIDTLSQLGEPFFFMVDFLGHQVEVYNESEIKKAGLLIDFQDFNNTIPGFNAHNDFSFHAFPEDMTRYREGFNLVQHHIQKGNSYLVNYTCKTPIETGLSLEELFFCTSAKYRVCKPGHFVFFSPETFIQISENTISTQPMKGTINAALPGAMEKLSEDEKEKAEHYTVVDLLRNDLSIVADGVEVKQFQRMDLIQARQRNLYAMSSEICGTLKPEFHGRIGSILKRILPAGSILGAPKKKTLDIILQAERHPRGWYTGVCGWYDGKSLDSCVMIRFIEEQNGKKFFRSGGGITHMSRLESEYEEMKNKIYVPVY